LRNIIKRAAVTAAVLGPLTLGVAALPAAPASASANRVAPASSYGCRVNDAPACGDQQEDNTTLVWAVPSSTPKPGSPVVLQQFSDARGDQDFEAVNINGLSSTLGAGPDLRFQLAENGDKTGLCISDPNDRAYTRLVLRPCNSAIWQEFVPVSSDGIVYAWATAQGGQAGDGWVVQDPAYTGNGVQLNVGPYDGQDNQLWAWNAGAAPITSF